MFFLPPSSIKNLKFSKFCPKVGAATIHQESEGFEGDR
jgi:hypothetical protein